MWLWPVKPKPQKESIISWRRSWESQHHRLVFFFFLGSQAWDLSKLGGDEHPQLILDVKARLPPVSFILTMWKNSIFLVFLSQIFDPKPRKKVHFLVGFRVSLAGFSGFLQLYMVFFTRTLFFKGFVWLRWLHQSSSESERRRNVFLGGWTSPCRYHFWANPSIMLLGIWCVYIYIHIRINIPSDPNISHSSWCMDIYIYFHDIYIYIHTYTYKYTYPHNSLLYYIPLLWLVSPTHHCFQRQVAAGGSRRTLGRCWRQHQRTDVQRFCA